MQIPSPLISLNDPYLQTKGVHIDVKRDDLIDPLISGNKYRKLQAHLKYFHSTGLKRIISMGGPWSNHLHALAKVCFDQNIPLECLIRGPEPRIYSATLDDIVNWGAQLTFLTRKDYRALRASYSGQQENDHNLADDDYFIPEGGYGALAMQGLRDLCEELPADYDHIYLGVGTATSMAGIVNAYPNPETHITGVLALEAGDSQHLTMRDLVTTKRENWLLNADFVGDGFARSSAKLEGFMWRIYQSTRLITEPIYTAKALYGLYQHIEEGRLCAGNRVLFIHTGGLQGLRGFPSDICQKLTKAAGF